ncbi:hypothetical protein [Mycolicibacterium farcinogenes]|uniref:Uncharacterized protein n=1 Tax=Mycolicibacterium farcinogenes TaxID=1802 RepID=A0ACD1FRC3_MYCFR|nr:hypothetical protein [Mycolicibacterium farcinogenes]QZH69597.1 hypothetical protein K6L26_31540 [Mycolicibacterium farcinogenes]
MIAFETSAVGRFVDVPLQTSREADVAADGDDQQDPAENGPENGPNSTIPIPEEPPPVEGQPILSDAGTGVLPDASTSPVRASQQSVPKHRFRWWALGIIATLCLLTGTGTLLTAALSTHDGATQVASDIAKTAIPTLLTLLGTATAWAFKSED